MPTTKKVWDEPPENLDEYKKWLSDTFNLRIDRIGKYYNHSITQLKEDIKNSVAWQSILKNLNNFSEEYEIATNSKLFKNIDEIELKTKTYESVINKSYRKDFCHAEAAKNWPHPSGGDWVLPNNCYSRINDLVRTSLVVRYLDGVSFLAHKIQSVLEENDLSCKIDFESRFEGHYAVHLAIEHDLSVLDIFDKNREIKDVTVSMEIQIVTQSHEVIRELLHPYYEKRRLSPNKKEYPPWEWNYKNEEFNVNYLGHVVQYVDGMIAQVLDRKEVKKHG